MTTAAQEVLADRHAVVTGGGRGIGAAIAHRLHAMGARVTIMGRDETVLRSQCLDERMQAVRIDVTDEDSVATAMASAREGFGPIAILINNAGIAESAPVHRTESELWHRTLGVNLSGVFYCIRDALPDMRQMKFGRIINIASVAAQKGYPYISAYCASKHGVVGLTRAVAMETVGMDIAVNAVCPGYVETEMLQRSIDNIVDKTGCTPAEAADQLKAMSPKNSFIQPTEVAASVAYLCSPEATNVTGQTISIAGGEVQT